MGNYFSSPYQEFIYKSRYSKYLPEESRREQWPETVSRYLNFMLNYIKQEHNYNFTDEERLVIEDSILNLEVMPSMRALMTSGAALARDHVAGYNCSYLPFDSVKSFDEEMYVLMNGTGVGYTVESSYVEQLPVVAEELFDTNTTIVVDDSKIGWVKSFRELINLLYIGQVPKWDLSLLRPKGARLKIFGGRSSGPDPLNELFVYTVNIFKKSAGRRLTTLEVHDIACMIASVVVVGGVRRSALISLSDIFDDRLRDCKSGAWWHETVHRRLANNSAVYETKPDIGLFMKEWVSLYESKSGERGIFSRQAVKKVIESANNFRKKHFGNDVRTRDANYDFGTNPCSEIILRPYQFCNLTEVIVRPNDTLETLKVKVRNATILGTIQSTLTKFKYLNKKWQKNCEDERLLGVSFTGIFDNEIMNGKKSNIVLANTLEELRKEAIKTNIEWADKLGINVSAAITCVKPSGTSSALNGTSSGIHPRHSEYYVRYVRNDIKDPVTDFLKNVGVPWEIDSYDPNQVCFKYPMKSPDGAIVRKDLGAIEHLELWKMYQIHWCEHKPSVTITVREDEWLQVGAWVYDNFDWMSGVSFLPYSDHVYKQAPFTDCTKEEYEALIPLMPKLIDWSKLTDYEKEDTTTGTQELACVAGGCEI